MRYKRASKALLKAESQVLNRLPIAFGELEAIWRRMNDDAHTERLIRCVLTLLANDKSDFGQPANLSYLSAPQIVVEPHELLNQINAFCGHEPMRVDVQVPVRKALRDCNLEFMEDEASTYVHS